MRKKTPCIISLTLGHKLFSVQSSKFKVAWLGLQGVHRGLSFVNWDRVGYHNTLTRWNSRVVNIIRAQRTSFQPVLTHFWAQAESIQWDHFVFVFNFNSIFLFHLCWSSGVCSYFFVQILIIIFFTYISCNAGVCCSFCCFRPLPSVDRFSNGESPPSPVNIAFFCSISCFFSSLWC